MVRTEIYINNTQVDLKDDFVYDLNFEISDIARPESRQANYSKTITIPASKNNDILFGHIFSLSKDILNITTTNFNPDFNPNLKATAQIFTNGSKVFDGVAQLTNIIRNEFYHIEYEIIVLGNIITPFSAIGEKYMTELDVSEYDHEYTRDNVVNSWDTSIIQGGVPVAFSLGNGYVYPMIDYGHSVDLINYDLEHFKGALYIKTLWDKIMDSIGFTYTSTILNSTFFKSLILPFNSPTLRLTASQILDRQFRTSTSSDITTPVTGVTNTDVLIYDDDTTAPNYDTSNQYNTGTGIFEVGATLNGVFSFTGQFQLQGEFIPSVGYSVIPNGRIHVIFRLKKDVGGVISTLWIGGVFIDQLKPQTGAFTTPDPAPYQLGLATIDRNFTTGMGYSAIGNHFNYNVSNIPLNAGDKVYMEYSYTMVPQTFGGTIFGSSDTFRDAATETIFTTGTFNLTIQQDSFIQETVADPTIIEGQTVLANNLLPNKVKQKDFMLSIIKALNLYVDIDPDVTNGLIIETRDDYYTSNIQDWSLKLDNDVDMVIKPMGALEANQYIYGYKEDKDYYNERYKNRWSEIYGTRTIDVANDFNKNKKSIDLIFSPTPLVGNNNFDRVISSIIKVDTAGVVSPFEGNIRLLYYGGLKDTNMSWMLHYDGGTTVEGFNQYPYAGHLDDVYNPTIDLNFGVPFEIFYDNRWQDINYSNGNLYNRYWKKQITEITDKNSKIVEANFNLKPIDIAKLSFRDLYYFDKNYFRLNKVVAYNPNSTNTTKCQFIKIAEAPSFALDTLPVDGSVKSYISGDEKAPLFGAENFGENNIPVRSIQNNNIVTGQRNYIGQGSVNISINGNDNIIGGDSRNVTIIGDQVAVEGGLENVYVFNSPDIEVTESNVVIINGQYVSGGDSVITLTAGTYTLDESKKTFLCDCSSGNVTINLPPVEGLEGNDYFIKRIDNTGQYKVTVIPNGSQTIDGKADFEIKKQNLSVIIQPDESNWYLH